MIRSPRLLRGRRIQEKPKRVGLFSKWNLRTSVSKGKTEEDEKNHSDQGKYACAKGTEHFYRFPSFQVSSGEGILLCILD